MHDNKMHVSEALPTKNIKLKNILKRHNQVEIIKNPNLYDHMIRLHKFFLIFVLRIYQLSEI